MHPTIALVLVTLLVSSITLYRWWRPAAGHLFWQLLLHLGHSFLCGLLIWTLSILMGWGPVHEIDSMLAGLGVLTTVGLGLGILSALALYFEEWRGLLGLFLPGQNRRPARHLRRKTRNFSVSTDSYMKESQLAALPLPARLDWCPECNRWHSAQANHEHSNLAG